ncbi:ferritin-like domain-containing protein [Mucilaginibacter sp. FT3.2]|uniref:ferritin-like domain-containing protein n=1 Tax=Mucilaginibacter sp. FT3.2 TaxID=2723090 RepID=UPI00160A1BD7|nr:ferritin-like protein [Mucilaginibacter sp. FT3.2]MBB6234027.1 rubrerythrin [Mucilaginibacter sp. FT3.2]
MSYLQVPRLNFAGQFQADPPTANNDPQHFDTANFKTNYAIMENGEANPNGWWNPVGTGAWNFYQCVVTSVTYKDGSVCDDPAIDPIVGTPVQGADARVAGKIVDLDPDQQMVSQLWGFQVNLGDVSSGLGFKSDFKTAPFGDISFSRCPSAGGDTRASAFYQSALDISAWANTTNSRYLSELAADGDTEPKQLSIKFVVDAFNMKSPDAANFTFGRIAGSIGTQHDNEPYRFIAGRTLNAMVPQLTTAYAVIQNNSLIIDLGNSFQTTTIAGPFFDIGKLYGAILVTSGNPVILGEIKYLDADWYSNTAGIVTLHLTDEQVTLAESNPIGIIQPQEAAPASVIFSESASGTYVRADDFVFRMSPGDEAKSVLYATSFGKPYAGQPIALAADASAMGAPSGPQNFGTPAAAFTFPASITTDANGKAELTMKATDPGNPRVYIDGQLYGISYALGTVAPAYGSIQNPSQMISALVFSDYAIPEQPNWVEHIQPIFQQYADLYPVMKPIVDLSNFSSVVGKLYILKNVFSMEMTNPNYMPVTRDLSEAKRAMIRKWLDNPVYMNLDSKEDLVQALQSAIELEHATIPPYLCALYSIKQGANHEVAGLIRSVVLEEMLHMALVSNILISIGGSPSIGHPKFMPAYPGSLPGGLRPGLIVSLKKCSIDHIRDCFMSIEEPDEIIIQKRQLLRNNALATHEKYTIAWFYKEVLKALENLSAAGNITFGNEDKQVTQWSGTGKLYTILSIDDARKAIHEIMDQGEGTSATSPDDNDGELSHYYKYAEIVEGRHLIKTDGGYGYVGTPIAYDQNGVWPMTDNPYTGLYPDGSRAQILNNQFSDIYRALLKGLHRTFNGEPQYLRDAVGAMFSLEVIALQLVQVPSGLNDGTTAGPSFQI